MRLLARWSSGHPVVVGVLYKPVFTWEMRSAMPSKWSVSGFDASTSKIATEQLEVVHLGFLEDDRS